MPISSRPKTERPRERLLEQGAKVLSDAELLLKFGGLRGFLAADLQHLKKEKGLGSAKIAALHYNDSDLHSYHQGGYLRPSIVISKLCGPKEMCGSQKALAHEAIEWHNCFIK